MAGLYIHIPLCRSKCIYCDFYSTAVLARADAVVDGLIAELHHRRAEVGDITTIYIGGGTPSVLSHEQIRRLVEALPAGHCTEFTIEANPEDITADTVALWRSLGINRVSMGVQTLSDDILRTLRRRHSAARALQAIATLQQGGITNISCDVIYGLPGLTAELWADTLHRLLHSGITHLSAYCLTVYEGTMLHRMIQRGRLQETDDDTEAAQFDILRQIADAHGFEHYEIANFARPGFHSRHNSAYWLADSQWLGIGPSAHSFDGAVRRIDHPDTARWLAELPYPCTVEEETPTERLNDFIVAALRTAIGLDLGAIALEDAEAIRRDAAPFLANGSMMLKDNHLAIAAEHWLIADSFIRRLLR